MRKILLYILTSTFILASCGGGGGSSSSEPTVAPPTISYIVNVSIDSGGSVPFSSISVKSGESTSFLISLEQHRKIENATGCNGSLDGFRYTSGSITENCSISITTKLFSDVPEGILEEYQSYAEALETVRERYGTRPYSINSESVWYKSLAIPMSNFEISSKIFTINDTIRSGVGYGSHLITKNNNLLVFWAYWKPAEADKGGTYALEYIDGEPSNLFYKKIQGATRYHVLENTDLTKTIVIPGVDEGEIADGLPGDAESFIFDIESKTWTELDIVSGAHGSIVFDYEQDGDDDIFAQSWGGIYDWDPILFHNQNGTIVPKRIPSIDNISYPMFIAPFYTSGGDLGIIFTDPLVDPKWNIPSERNVIGIFDPSLTNKDSLKNVIELPMPYFEREEFEGIEQVIPGWEGGVGLSHDVSAKAIDLDYDSDLDIVIGSMIWSDEFPYGVIQILINNDGVYEDETDRRLFNWVLAGNSAHQLDFIDVNSDGFIDILVSDHGDSLWNLENFDYKNSGIGGGSRVLLNDGTGHFMVVAHHQIHKGENYGVTHVPSIDLNNLIRFTQIQPKSLTNNISTRTVLINKGLSTGPNGRDPAEWGYPDFNEFYYILHNPEVKDSIESGEFANGLDHYINYGEAKGLKTNAK